jgi:hypothetical protein
MKIDLEGLDIGLLVQSAFASTLKEQLAKQLPSIVNSMLTEKTGYGKESANLVQRAFRSAVDAEINKCLGEFVADRTEQIQSQVRLALEQQLDADSVAERVAESLYEVKVQVRPFKNSSKKASDLDDEKA